MNRYILIGGIGSGKSTVAKLFEACGAYCVDMDVLGHEALQTPEVVQQLSDAFGPEVLDAHGQIARRRLASVAFATEEATQRLNSITQPHIVLLAEAALQHAEQMGHDLAIVEVSAYAGPGTTLAGIVEKANGLIAVVAPEEIRVSRAVASGYAIEDVLLRIKRQVSDEQRMQWADYIIENDGSMDELRTQVTKLYRKLSS